MCIISCYDGGYSWSVCVEDLFIRRQDKGHVDYSFWNDIINGFCGNNLDERVEIYNKYNVDIIIVCEDGCIDIYTLDEDCALHEKYNF